MERWPFHFVFFMFKTYTKTDKDFLSRSENDIRNGVEFMPIYNLQCTSSTSQVV